jgi:hypothetical protein
VFAEKFPEQRNQIIDQGEFTCSSSLIVFQEVIYSGLKKISVFRVKIGGHGKAVTLSPLMHPLRPVIYDFMVIVKESEQ